MPGELRVDTTPLATEGQGLLSAAGDIPQPPVPFTATGADALSTILNARTQAMEAPLIAGLPVTKAEALRTAQNIIQAAAKYEGVDQQLADQVLKALSELEGAERVGAGGVGAGGGAAGAAGIAGTPAGAATSAATPAAGAAQQAGQMGQLMGLLCRWHSRLPRYQCNWREWRHPFRRGSCRACRARCSKSGK